MLKHKIGCHNKKSPFDVKISITYMLKKIVNVIQYPYLVKHPKLLVFLVSHKIALVISILCSPDFPKTYYSTKICMN